MRLPAVHHDSRIFRISLLLALLVCSLTSFAQPQAPVNWSQSEVRWLGVGTQWLYYYQALAIQGDTIFIADRRYDDGQENPYLALFYSYNNGLTFDSTRLDTGYWDSPDVCLSATSGRVTAFCNDDYPRGWIRHSPTNPLNLSTCYNSSGPGPTAGYSLGAQDIAIQALVNIDTQLVIEAISSEDAGNTWSAPQDLNTGRMQVIDNGLCATQGHFLALGVQWSTIENATILYVNRRQREELTWRTFNRLTGQPYSSYNIEFNIAGDTTSETAIVLSATDISFAGAPKQLRIHRTIDGGETWELPRLLTTDAPISGLIGGYPTIFCSGKRWGAVWEKSEGNADDFGLCWRFSANHGKDWYPVQRVLYSYYQMKSSTGQFCNDEVRLYWRGSPGSGIPADYGMTAGLITQDTIAPVLTMDPLSSDTVDVGDHILFSTSAADNDTLSGVTLTVLDSTNVPYVLRLARQSPGHYWSSFTVPHTGYYRYRLTAEDFWENSTSDPDSGWASFHTRGWSDADPHFIVHPSSFSVSVFPNPFNSETRIGYSLPVTSQTTITLHDLLGRTVRVLADKTIEAGSHEFILDGSPLPSGIYFLRLQAGSFAQTRKIVLLK